MENTIAFIVGLTLAPGVALFAHWVGFDRERSFYPVVMIVIAALYVLFALAGGGGAAFLQEVPGFILFSTMAVLGFRRSLWWAAVALALHGVFDIFHGHLIDNPGVPAWWPAFCATYDIVAALYLGAQLSKTGSDPAPKATPG